MFKFVTIYRKVDEPHKIDDFFSHTHLPLAEQLPNLVKSEVSRVKIKPGGESRYYLMYEIYFESEALFRAALMTEAGVRMIEALLPWAEAQILTWYDAETWEDAHRPVVADDAEAAA